MSFTRDMKIRHLESLVYEEEFAKFQTDIKELDVRAELAKLKAEETAEKIAALQAQIAKLQAEEA